jgi:hypothetical protein
MLLGPLHAQGYVTAAMPVTAPLGLFAPSDVSLPFRGRWAGRRHFSRWAFVVLKWVIRQLISGCSTINSIALTFLRAK